MTQSLSQASTPSGMTLRRAKEIAAKVGATIVEKEPRNYLVTLGVKAVGPDGMAFPQYWGATPQIATTLALIETGRAAIRLADQAKQAYAESEVLF